MRSVFLEASFIGARRTTNHLLSKVLSSQPPGLMLQFASWGKVAAHLDERTLGAAGHFLLSFSTAHIVGATKDHLGGVALLAVSWKVNLIVIPGGHNFLWSMIYANGGSSILPSIDVAVVSMLNLATR